MVVADEDAEASVGSASLEEVDLAACEEGFGAEEGDGGGFAVWYFTGDSFSRNSRRLGSRSRKGSPLLSFELPFLPEPQSQPIGNQIRQG